MSPAAASEDSTRPKILVVRDSLNRPDRMLEDRPRRDSRRTGKRLLEIEGPFGSSISEVPSSHYSTLLGTRPIEVTAFPPRANSVPTSRLTAEFERSYTCRLNGRRLTHEGASRTLAYSAWTFFERGSDVMLYGKSS